MNTKAEKLKQYLAENNITYFKVEENSIAEDTANSESENLNSQSIAKTLFHTYIKIFGQKLPTVVIVDDSIYTLIRVQVIPDITYTKNNTEFIKCVNEININYKAVKYYLGTDNALYLDMYISSLNDELDGNLVISMINAMNVHLTKEYPNWMKLLWS